jgi:DNA-binding CsgD family transcriptional regulator/PAS domain-containing protein
MPQVEQTLVDSIYDGVLESPPWKTFLHLFRRQLNCVASGLWLRSPMLEQIKLSLWDADPEYEKILEPFMDRHHKSAVLFRSDIAHGEVKVFSDVISVSDLKKTDYYHQFLVPNNIGDGLQFLIEEPEGLRLWIELGRSAEDSSFGDEEKQFCYALVPHLRRALSIYSRMMRFESEADIYSQLVEQLTVGVIILDRDAQVIKVSSLAESLIDELDCIEVRSEKLRFSKKIDQEAYDASFQKALGRYESSAQSSTAELLRIEPSAGQPIGLLVKCLAPNPWYEGKGCPVVVLYLCDSTAHKSAREYFVAKLFGLTISEAALAILLADGKTLAEAAQLLNVTENTARTVSKRIFSKTGVRRQAELVRLILNSVALLA